MYAITLDLDHEMLIKAVSNENLAIAYGNMRQKFQQKGFFCQQGGGYMGEKSKNAVDCVLAVLEISKELPWFYSSVKQIRMLRITSDDDLMPVILGAVAKDD